jgi:NitT/TauT family transport system ATP-binding protein
LSNSHQLERSGVSIAGTPMNHTVVTPMLDVVGLSLGYQTPAGMSVAVRDVNFSVRRGETAILLGPSGCGKSTILKSVAGFIKPLQGTVVVADRQITRPGPDRAVVFQEFDQLFPWRTVLDNVSYPLRATGKASRAEAQERAGHWLGIMRLEAAAHKFPHQLSGGMKQRVAIARALALEPAVLLMDEPFGALDPQTRLRLQLEVIEVVKRTAATVLFVTHSIAEAALIGHDIIILDGTPSSVASIVDARSVSDPTSQEALEVGRQVARLMGQEASHVIGD